MKDYNPSFIVQNFTHRIPKLLLLFAKYRNHNLTGAKFIQFTTELLAPHKYRSMTAKPRCNLVVRFFLLAHYLISSLTYPTTTNLKSFILAMHKNMISSMLLKPKPSWLLLESWVLSKTHGLTFSYSYHTFKSHSNTIHRTSHTFEHSEGLGCPSAWGISL